MDTQTQETFPYDVLESFGLTREMIDDLPEYILETICNGGRSPLLPITINTDDGIVTTHAKFRIAPSPVDMDKMDVVFYPKLNKANLEMFNEDEKELLLEGKAILATIDIPDEEGSALTHKEECFVQIEPDTNHVFYVHTPVIGRNLLTVDSYLDLSPDDMDILTKGGLVTVNEPETMTVGIDIFTTTGVFVCQGDEQNWRKIKDKAMPHYSFGVEGCWVNGEEGLHYVKEEDFDSDIEAAFQSTLENKRAEQAYQSEENYYPKDVRNLFERHDNLEQSKIRV